MSSVQNGNGLIYWNVPLHWNSIYLLWQCVYWHGNKRITCYSGVSEKHCSMVPDHNRYPHICVPRNRDANCKHHIGLWEITDFFSQLYWDTFILFSEKKNFIACGIIWKRDKEHLEGCFIIQPPWWRTGVRMPGARGGTRTFGFQRWIKLCTLSRHRKSVLDWLRSLTWALSLQTANSRAVQRWRTTKNGKESSVATHSPLPGMSEIPSRLTQRQQADCLRLVLNLLRAPSSHFPQKNKGCQLLQAFAKRSHSPVSQTFPGKKELIFLWKLLSLPVMFVQALHGYITWGKRRKPPVKRTSHLPSRTEPSLRSQNNSVCSVNSTQPRIIWEESLEEFVQVGLWACVCGGGCLGA